MKDAKPDPKSTTLTDAKAVVVVSPLTVTVPTEALEALPGDTAAGKAPKDHASADAEEAKVTEHHVTIGGVEVAYTVTTGTMTLADEDGKAKAKVFLTAYTRQGGETAAARPITFTFNGGPGSSSVWLHMGAFGPRRVVLPDDASLPPPPFTLADNPWSLLDLTDLVFIDPVSTGFSRAVTGSDAAEYHGVTPDVESVGEVIRLYCARHGRWASPKYLAGESYGTTRAANLVHHLQDRHGMYFNGVVLVSSVLHFQTLVFDTDNDLPYVLYLPGYTATAFYHGRLEAALQGDGSPAALEAALAEAEAFALGDYQRALFLGTRLDAAERDRVAAEAARLMGLDARVVARSNLRVPLDRFAKELRRSEARTVGRLDSRYVGIDRDAGGAAFEYDPSYSAIQGPYSAALNHYVRAELGYVSDLAYEVLTDRVRPWRFDTAENRYLDVAEPLRKAITRNPHLGVFVASGYYDLATPYFATQHTFHHLGLDASLEANVRIHHYPAGHMMYIHQPSLAQLKADLAAFYGATQAGG